MRKSVGANIESSNITKIVDTTQLGTHCACKHNSRLDSSAQQEPPVDSARVVEAHNITRIVDALGTGCVRTTNVKRGEDSAVQ